MATTGTSNKQGHDYIFPLVIIGTMFFAIGFALGINSYLIPLLQRELGVSAGESYLVLAATFSAFLIFGYPASFVIKRIGYKNTMMLAFFLFAAGFFLYIPSAKSGSLVMFLIASFISGMGNTFLQAAVNPYVTILGPIESAARRISFMGIANKLAWPVAPLFLSAVIGKEVSDVTLGDTIVPFFIIIAVFIGLGVFTYFAPLQEVKAVGEEDGKAGDCPYAAKKSSIWQFPHLLIGVLALFIYVGVETITLGTLVDFAYQQGLQNPELYAWIGPAGLVVGYVCGIIFIPRFISQSTALIVCALTALAGSIMVLIVPVEVSIYFVAIIALGCSLMWPAIWPLAMADLGRFTKKGGSLMVVAIVGGALIPLVYGFLKDAVGAREAYWIFIPCFLFILFYALKGHKIRV